MEGVRKCTLLYASPLPVSCTVSHRASDDRHCASAVVVVFLTGLVIRRALLSALFRSPHGNLLELMLAVGKSTILVSWYLGILVCWYLGALPLGRNYNPRLRTKELLSEYPTRS
jgi:hypothetical protein